jgi:hypothetical protein
MSGGIGILFVSMKWLTVSEINLPPFFMCSSMVSLVHLVCVVSWSTS